MGGLYGFMLREAFPYYGPHKPFFISTVGQCVSPQRQETNTLNQSGLVCVCRQSKIKNNSVLAHLSVHSSSTWMFTVYNNSLI